MVNLQSTRIKIKSITKWRYEVSLFCDHKDVYYIVSTNTLMDKSKTESCVDYKLAMQIFDSRIANFEGH